MYHNADGQDEVWKHVARRVGEHSIGFILADTSGWLQDWQTVRRQINIALASNEQISSRRVQRRQRVNMTC